jgi:hypothetical protein
MSPKDDSPQKGIFMAIEVMTIRRVYIADREKARKSAVHTVYCGSQPLVPGSTVPQPLAKLEFIFGVARNVPTQDYQRFADLGHATDKRPKSAYEEAEERELQEEREQR